MTRDEVGRLLVVVTDEYGEEVISSEEREFYGDFKEMVDWFIIEYHNDIAISILCFSPGWIIEGGFSVGDSIQSIVDSGSFSNFRHNTDLTMSIYEAVDVVENPTYFLSISYNILDNVSVIGLAYFRDYVL